MESAFQNTLLATFIVATKTNPMYALQIYNECINDLLAPAHMRLAKPVSLRLKEDKTGHINVQGLSEVTNSAAVQGHSKARVFMCDAAK